MKKITWLFILLGGIFIGQISNAQTILGLEQSAIETMVNDKDGVYFHPELVKRFAKNDTSLIGIDYVMLYYGFVYRPEYNPYKHFAWEDSLGSLTNQQKGKEALQLADKLLKDNPISIFGNIEMAYTLKGLGKDTEALQYLWRFNQLIKLIEGSGVGDSYENPIFVISPKDAQAIIYRYKLSVIQKTINGREGRYYDVYLVKNEQGAEYPIYFDITLPYTIGMKKLDKKGD
jgi:hypothetical protein